MMTYHDAVEKAIRGCDGSHPSRDLQWWRLSDFLSKRYAACVSCVAEHLICIQGEAGPLCVIFVETEFRVLMLVWIPADGVSVLPEGRFLIRYQNHRLSFDIFKQKADDVMTSFFLFFFIAPCLVGVANSELHLPHSFRLSGFLLPPNSMPVGASIDLIMLLNKLPLGASEYVNVCVCVS